MEGTSCAGGHWSHQLVLEVGLAGAHDGPRHNLQPGPSAVTYQGKTVPAQRCAGDVYGSLQASAGHLLPSCLFLFMVVPAQVDSFGCYVASHKCLCAALVYWCTACLQGPAVLPLRGVQPTLALEVPTMTRSNFFMPFALKAATKEVLRGDQQVGADSVTQDVTLLHSSG